MVPILAFYTPIIIIHISSISERVNLRESLQCKSFQWFLDHVYPELKIPDTQDLTFGSIRQLHNCLDTLGKLTDGVVGVFGCHGAGGNQEWSFTKAGQIKHGDLCLGLETPTAGTRLKLRLCSSSVLQVSHDS